MVKTSPEKLAAALRANLRRRKEAAKAADPKKPAEPAPKPHKKPGFP
jgi:hypothetical protein